jgi:hypothetical protein
VGRRCDEDGEEDDQKRGYRQVATHEPQCSLPNTSAAGTGRSLGLWPVGGYPGVGSSGEAEDTSRNCQFSRELTQLQNCAERLICLLSPT